MTHEHEATKDGIGEAFAVWAYQHPITIAEAVEDGTEKAIRAWLDANSRLLAEQIASAITRNRTKP